MRASVKVAFAVQFAIAIYSVERVYAQSPGDAPSAGPGEPARGTDEPTPPAEALPSFVRSASGEYLEPTDADVAAARSDLIAALDELGQYLRRAGANGRAWARFLKLDGLRAQLDPSTPPDRMLLEDIARRFRSGHNGLELPPFARVGDTLRLYLDTTAQVGNQAAREQYRTAIDQLATSLQDYEQSPSSKAFEEAAEALAWLHRYGQSPRIVQRVRQRFSQPNLYVHVGADLVSAAIARPVDETEPVSDVILGTRISGTGRTVGRLGVQLVPNDRHAVFDTILVATNYSRTIGRNGPARIHSSAQTSIVGRQRFTIDAAGLRTFPAASSATTRSTIRGVSSTKRGLMDCLVKRVASKRIPKQKRASERIAARHAEERFNARFERESRGLLARVRRRFSGQAGTPRLVDPATAQLRFSTTADALRVRATGQSPGHLAAAGDPPPAPDGADLSVRMHASFFNNLAERSLAGRTLDQPQVRKLAIDTLGEIPAAFDEPEDSEPWSITFASRRPISVAVDDGIVSITVRGQRYTSGARRFSGMNVTARYQVIPDGSTTVALRQGELEILPPGFVPGRGQTIPLRLETLRNLLKHRFEDVFPPQIDAEPLVLPGQAARAGVLQLSDLKADDGWLGLAWRQAETRSRLASTRGAD